MQPRPQCAGLNPHFIGSRDHPPLGHIFAKIFTLQNCNLGSPYNHDGFNEENQDNNTFQQINVIGWFKV